MLIATGIMAIGLVLVATIFPVGVKLTTMSTERSIAAVTADEAFAKVQLYGLRDTIYWPGIFSDFRFTADYDFDNDNVVDQDDAITNWTQFSEFYYPSDGAAASDSKYCWSALCRRPNPATPDEYQVTVFVNRMTFGGNSYYGINFDGSNYAWINTNPYPSPVRVNANYTFDGSWLLNDPRRRLLVLDLSSTADDNTKWPSGVNFTSFIDEGYTLVSHTDGMIYQVEEMKDVDVDGIRETIVLRQDWQWAGYPVEPADGTYSESVWVVPPAVGSSRYPCVGVYQKVIRFD